MIRTVGKKLSPLTRRRVFACGKVKQVTRKPTYPNTGYTNNPSRSSSGAGTTRAFSTGVSIQMDTPVERGTLNRRRSPPSGWTFGIVLRESEAYHNSSLGRLPGELFSFPCRFADFVVYYGRGSIERQVKQDWAN